MPEPELDVRPGARVGIVAYGTSHWALVESRDQLRAEARLDTSYLRLKAYPFTHHLAEFIDAHDRVYVVEQNRDGQMFGLMRQELSGVQIGKLASVRHYNGLPIDARSVTEEIRAHEARMALPAETSPEDAIVGAEEAV